MLACSKLSKELFDAVQQEYSAALARDPQFEGMLHEIARVYFGVGGGAAGLGGLLGSLLGGK